MCFRNHTDQIENPAEEMALRLSSHLLVGLSRIYTRKVHFLFTDCNEALSKITMVSAPPSPTRPLAVPSAQVHHHL